MLISRDDDDEEKRLASDGQSEKKQAKCFY
jgi:hypothetical protein